MSRRTLPTTQHAELSHVGHTLDEDLPRINENYEKIDAQLAQAFKEREALRTSTSEANTLLEQQVNKKLQAESTKNAEKNTKLLNTVNTSIKNITKKHEDFTTNIKQEEEILEKYLTELLVSHASLGLEGSAHNFPKGKEGQMLTIKDGKLVFEYTYPLCEVKTWRHPTLKPGFMPAQGGLIKNAKERYPDAWEYLQTEEGKLLCVTEDEWQAMTKAVWATLADGTKVGWKGVGGAPFYVQDLDAGTLRVPDLRGMYAEAAGFDGLKTGGVHGDGIPAIKGSFGGLQYPYTINALSKNIVSGAFTNMRYGCAKSPSRDDGGYVVDFNSSLVVQTANKVQPRAWGALVCVFLGAENTL